MQAVFFVLLKESSLLGIGNTSEFSIEQKPSGQEQTAAERSYVAKGAALGERALGSRICRNGE